GQAEGFVKDNACPEISRRVLEVFDQVTLQSPFEKIAFKKALQGSQNLGPWLGEVLAFLKAGEPSAGAFDRLVESFYLLSPDKKDNLLVKWPNVTLIPFLVRKTGCAFVKPTVTKL